MDGKRIDEMLTRIVYAVVYGLSGLRESIIDPEGGHGYVRLQQ